MICRIASTLRKSHCRHPSSLLGIPGKGFRPRSPSSAFSIPSLPGNSNIKLCAPTTAQAAAASPSPSAYPKVVRSWQQIPHGQQRLWHRSCARSEKVAAHLHARPERYQQSARSSGQQRSMAGGTSARTGRETDARKENLYCDDSRVRDNCAGATPRTTGFRLNF